MDIPGEIVIATYNVLADAYIKPEFYPHVDPLLLAKEVRYPRIAKRIAELRTADVICLQEVDYELFALVDSRLRKLGYQGRWAHKGRGRPDGCTTFIHKSWKTAETRILVFQDEHIDGEQSGHVALINVIKKDGTTLTVANTHLKWDPPGTPPERQYGLAQASELLRQLGEQRFRAIICGDLNAEKESDTIQELLRFRFVDAHDSSVATANPSGKAKKIDYILCHQIFRPHPFPTTIVDDQTLLPSSTEPSDHILLAAALVIE